MPRRSHDGCVPGCATLLRHTPQVCAPSAVSTHLAGCATLLPPPYPATNYLRSSCLLAIDPPGLLYKWRCINRAFELAPSGRGGVARRVSA